jgi:hypothetical protein
MEKCSKCGVEFLSGTLTRDSVDAALLYCEKCRPKEKKPRKPRKRKEPPVIATAAPPVTFVEPPPIPPEKLRKDAEAWAIECGLPKVRVHDPIREDYPRYGFGYVMQIMEVGGKDRKATARYTCKGERSYWTIDGMVTG